MPDQPRIILDCDPGHDDAMAILLAGQYTQLLGITTVSGNAPLTATTRNALICTQIFNLDTPVHAGADRPLLVDARYATEAHGSSGLDGPTLPTLQREPASPAVTITTAPLTRWEQVRTSGAALVSANDSAQVRSAW